MGTGKFVGGEGNKDSDIVIIGEAPGKNEARQGRPFVGRAGKLLTKSMTNAGIHRKNCYITNVVKEKPYKNNIKPFIDHKTGQVSTKGQKYIEMLEKELAETDPNVIVAVGNTPLWVLTGKSGITNWRGSILEATRLVEGTKVIPIIHPAASLHRGPQAYMYRHYILKDLYRVKNEANFSELRIPDYDYIIEPSYHQTLQYLKECQSADSVAFDIEVYNHEVDCISFSKEKYEAISIPFKRNQEEYFTPPQELEVWKAIDKILSDPSIEVIAHNANFDSSVLFRRYGIKPTNIKDTMINAAVLYPDFPKGLDFLTSIYTKMPYYKDDGKFKNPNVTNREFWIYNAKDSAVLKEIYPKQVNELKKTDNLETARKQTRLIRPLLYMYEHGIKMDTEQLNQKRDDADQKMQELRAEIAELAGHPVNPNSYKQVGEYFYDELGLKEYTKNGKRTTNELAMKRISRKGYREAEIVLEYRGLSKAKGSYYEMEFDDDDRLRSSFNPVGTRTGRLSSSKTIFGTGGNMQNLTVPFKECMNPDESHVGYEIDLGQAENRVVAYIGPDHRMIKAFENGTDIHKLTATMVFNKPIEEISAEKGSASIGNGKQSERYWGKQANHCKRWDSKVLTPEGWVTMREAWRKEKKIAQWNPKTEEVSFTKPSKWYIDKYTGDMITLENERIYQEVTPDHRMPLWYERKYRGKERKFKWKYAKNFPNSGHYSSPLSGHYSGKINTDPTIIRFLVAFQADGSWNHGGIRFKLWKKRKLKRIKKILDKGGWNYNEVKNGISLGKHNELTEITRYFLGEDKNFDYKLLHLSQMMLQVFIDELPYWDGYRGNNKKLYFTTNENNIEWVQTICHLIGRSARIRERDQSETDAYGEGILYSLHISSQISPASHAINRSAKEVEDLMIMCPTVDTGYFLTKEEGKISVTGNSFNYDLGYRSFARDYEIPIKDGKYIYDSYHKMYPGVRKMHEMIKQQLKKNRTVTNLFGRNYRFMGRFGDSMFKEAYAFIPQSTVADIINRWGLLEVYYNQNVYRPIKLLSQVHDSIVFQISTEYDWAVHARVIKEICKSMEKELEFHGRRFSIPAEVTMFPNNFKDGHEFDEVTHLSTMQIADSFGNKYSELVRR